jgi:hypothetical protein
VLSPKTSNLGGCHQQHDAMKRRASSISLCNNYNIGNHVVFLAWWWLMHQQQVLLAFTFFPIARRTDHSNRPPPVCRAAVGGLHLHKDDTNCAGAFGPMDTCDWMMGLPVLPPGGEILETFKRTPDFHLPSDRKQSAGGLQLDGRKPCHCLGTQHGCRQIAIGTRVHRSGQTRRYLF